LTVTLSVSEGDNSVNILVGQALGQEVEQDIEDQFVVEENNNGPVIVQGDLPAANFDNFIQLGEGVQNVMLAYYDVDAENPQPQNNPPLVDDVALGLNEDVMFNENDLVPPEVAHVQVGMALTHFFPMENEKHLTEKFSEQGLLLWEKYFAPHLSSDANQEGFSAKIPVSWFNFITILLMTPEKFDWTKNFLKSSLWEIISETDINEPNIAFLIPEKCSVQSKPRCTISEVPEEEIDTYVVPPSAPTRKRRSNVHLVESEVNDDALDKKLMKKSKLQERGKERLMVNMLPQRSMEERRALMQLLLSMERKGRMLVLLVQLHSKSRRKIPRVNQ
jgi:hypothetical protein